MHRISPNNPVRRRLFSEDNEEARVDNFANLLQESMVTDREQKKARWNFDFENDVPLEGDYEWYRCDGPNEWIGVKNDTKVEEQTKLEESFQPIQHENEVTPKSREEETAPLIRKRRKDIESCSDKARRRISFD